mgnify:CR=1 FL=1
MNAGNNKRVLLDLNFDEFQSELFELDIQEIKKMFKTFRKLRAMTWNEVFKDNGIKWEEIKSLPNKYTIRLSQSYRAVVVRVGNLMRFQALHRDHDATYGKK